MPSLVPSNHNPPPQKPVAGSRTGLNCLGSNAPIFYERWQAAEASVRTFPAGSLQQAKARARVTRLQNELRRLKAALGMAEPR